MREKKIFCFYGCLSILRISKEKIAYLDTIEFFDTHICINNPHWQNSGIIFLWKCCIVISDTLIGSFLDVFFLLLAVILSELHGKSRRNKDWVTEKSSYKNLYEGYYVFDCTPFFLCYFLLLSSSTLSPFPTDVRAEWSDTKYYYRWYSVWFYHE